MSEKRKHLNRCIVVKFGGSSLADGSRISRAVKAVIKEAEKGTRVVVVVSAIGKTTDLLIDASKRAGVISEDELDDILSMGERTSARIFSSALKAGGVPCHYFDPANLDWPIITDNCFSNANPVLDICEKRVKEYFFPLLNQGVIVVIPGFVGKTRDGLITTMGRGGSDTTALIAARALSADQVILVTDVDGILSADPKIIRDPRRLEEIDVDTLVGLADTGSKFIHKKALKYKDHSIDVKVVNWASDNLDSGGTIIRGGLSNNVIVEMAFPQPAMAITIVGKALSKSSQILQSIFRKIREVKTTLLGLSIDYNSLILYLPINPGEDLLESLHTFVVDHKQTLALAVRKNLAFIRVKGVGLEETPGIISRTTQSLYSEGINIFGIFTITSSVLVFVDLEDGEKAIKLIRKSVKANSNKLEVR